MTQYPSLRNLAKPLLPFQQIKLDEPWMSLVTVKTLCFHCVESWLYVNTVC